jgi:hypothetical protein
MSHCGTPSTVCRIQKLPRFYSPLYDLPEFRVGSTRFPHAPALLLIRNIDSHRRASRVQNPATVLPSDSRLQEGFFWPLLPRGFPQVPEGDCTIQILLPSVQLPGFSAACASACAVAFCWCPSFVILPVCRGFCRGLLFFHLLFSRFYFRHPEPFSRPFGFFREVFFFGLRRRITPGVASL